jgi:hypothetical protein
VYCVCKNLRLPRKLEEKVPVARASISLDHVSMRRGSGFASPTREATINHDNKKPHRDPKTSKLYYTYRKDHGTSRKFS